VNPSTGDSVVMAMHISRLRRLSVLFVVAGLAVALSACSSSGSKGAAKSNAPGATISIASFKFSAVTVAAGATVTVSNNDAPTHTVTSDDGKSFNVKVAAGKTATFTAPSTPGTYKFHCNIHSTMHGVLTVT
jgi:plastocyanin